VVGKTIVGGFAGRLRSICPFMVESALIRHLSRECSAVVEQAFGCLEAFALEQMSRMRQRSVRELIQLAHAAEW
jgi:hypothetical protein